MKRSLSLKRALLFLSSTICLTACEKTVDKCFDFNKYDYYREEVEGAKNCLPSAAELGEYKAVQFAYREVRESLLFGFYDEGISLFVDYSEEVYSQIKEEVVQSHHFIEEVDPSKEREYLIFPMASFDYNDYSFRIALPPFETSDGIRYYYDCSRFVMIGFNEELSSIAYLYFYNFDLDYLYSKDDPGDINDVMPKFIKRFFYWRK